jgi:hypothetical protein
MGGGKFEHRQSLRSGGFSRPGGEPFQYAARDALQLAELRQVLLKIPVQIERSGWIQLRSQDHIAQMDGVRQHGLIAQLIERQ